MQGARRSPFRGVLGYTPQEVGEAGNAAGWPLSAKPGVSHRKECEEMIRYITGVLAVLFFAAMVLSGCETIKGTGRDISNFGKMISGD